MEEVRAKNVQSTTPSYKHYICTLSLLITVIDFSYFNFDLITEKSPIDTLLAAEERPLTNQKNSKYQSDNINSLWIFASTNCLCASTLG